MNDHDVEKLVSRLQRPAPSAELDARIAAITSRAQPLRAGSPIRGLARISAAIACAGLVGFVLGRQSVATPAAPPTIPEVGSPLATTEQEPAPEVRAVVPASDAFVRLVTKPRTFVSVFGGPLEEQSGSRKVQ